MFKTTTLVLVIFGSLLTLVLFLGNAGGAGLVQKLDRTGSPLSPGPCQACHSQGTFNPSLDVKLLANNQPVTTYTPGETYTFRVIVNANPNASVFGFQAVALLPNGNLQAGTFQAAPVGISIRTVDDRKYPEHTFPSLKDTFSLQWVAPPMNSGEVRFYAAGVAANGNSNSSGDGSATSTLFITEAIPSSTPMINAEKDLFNVVRLGDQLYIQCPQKEGNLLITDLNGRIVKQQSMGLWNDSSIPTGELSTGIYIVSWFDSHLILSRKIVLH